MKRQITYLLLAGVLIAAMSGTQRNSFPVPTAWPDPVYDFDRNPLQAEKIELGRNLFYDPILSADGKISCASCHNPYNGFAHADHALSHGIGDRSGTRNAPALFNLAWQTSFMWDGAIADLDMQPLAPIAHPDEMGESIGHVLEKLQASEKYRSAFAKAWGSEEINSSRLLFSLSQFMVSLVSASSRYDQVKQGQAKFTAQEEKGYAIFQQHCNTCHREPLFTDYSFRNNGLSADETLKDSGRMKITRKSSDSLLFRVPSLRNLEYSYPYMHDGRFKKLSQVIDHYVRKKNEHESADSLLKNGIDLSEEDQVDLIAFLLTLTDKKFLFSPDHAYPVAFFHEQKQDP